MKFILVASILGFLAALVGSPQAAISIDPSDPNILYTGRWDSSNPSQPWSYWIGSSIIVEFEGVGIEASMGAGDSGRPDYLRVIVDDDLANSMKIPVPLTATTFTLASGLTDTAHKIEIIKETDIGRWTLYSLGLNDGDSVVPPSPRPAHKIAFFGDSNLAGYSLESEQNESGDELRGSHFGYAGVASRILDAEYQNISRSGATVSSIHGEYDLVEYGSDTPIWDFSQFPADVVVVNAGANDVGRPIHKIKEDYHAFLDDLRTTHPGAHIMLYNSWGWSYGEPANFIHEVIAERNDSNMSWAVFPWIFEQWHGCEYDHAGMAGILADHLTSTLGWSQKPRDVMSGFGKNGNVANGSFEEVAPFGGYGWRYYTDPGVSRVYDPAGAHGGDFHLRLSSGASSHQPNPASDGETFTLVLWLRGGQNGDEVDVTMDFRDQEMWTTPLQTETEAISLTTGWEQYSMTATAPVGAANPVFHTRVTFTAGEGAIVDIDDVGMSSPTGIPVSGPLPTVGRLSASPNPFNPSINIEFRLPEAGFVLLNVYDVSGRRVATITEGHYQKGIFSKRWNGRNFYGQEVGSGTYFARIEAGKFSETRKMVLIR
ncbi:MAG: T9SS type A sorting domain-containing protein [Gemmatimonadales bacterium]|nr:T9SS type A sorting domain-containing protein [Gemmatimonadales bacterium]